MTVQASLCRTWLEPKLQVFSCTGSHPFSKGTVQSQILDILEPEVIKTLEQEESKNIFNNLIGWAIYVLMV